MNYTDKELVCKECADKFVFSASEQEHHARLGLRNEPRRCAVCRQAARMRNEDRGGRPPRRIGGPRPPGAGPPRPGGPMGPREVFQAVCAQCGKQTDLPFKPRGDRPVYCRQCFAARR